MARPVPTVTPPAIGVDKLRGAVVSGAAAFTGAVSAAINGRLKEVIRARVSSFFMFMLLERMILEGYWDKGIVVSMCIASERCAVANFSRKFNPYSLLMLGVTNLTNAPEP